MTTAPTKRSPAATPATLTAQDARGYILTSGDLACEVTDMLDRVSRPDWRLITTGVPALDRDVTIYPGSVAVVVGRPGMGKSQMLKALAMREMREIQAKRASDPGCMDVVVYVTLEESARKLGMQLGRLGSMRDIYRRQADAADVRRRALYLVDLPIVVVRHPGIVDGRIAEPLSSGRTLRAVEQMVSDFGYTPKLICLDYLQLMQGDDDGPKYSARSKADHVMAASHGAVMIARSLDTAVFLAVQSGRETDNRQPPLPQMSDMQHSSAIEQDADVILGLCRPMAIPAIREAYLAGERPTVEAGGRSYPVTDNLALIGVCKSRDDDAAGRRYVARIDPVTMDIGGMATDGEAPAWADRTAPV